MGKQNNEERPSGEVEQDTQYSPAGLEAPEVEIEIGEVMCAGCGESVSADEIGVTADEVTETEGGVVGSVTRYYLHNDEDCMMAFIEADNEQ